MPHAVTSGLISSLQAGAIGEAESFESVVRLYRPKIFRFMLASLRDRHVAENLTQDCFLNAFKAMATFRNDCSMSTWLMQIAVNLVRDYSRNRRLQFWRRIHRTAKPNEEELRCWISSRQNSPEAELVIKEEVKAIWDAAARLPERQRTVLLLRFVEDMEILEIAAATGMKEGTVKTHLFRAVHSIRQRIGA